MIKPKIEWHEFLSAAPNFTALLTDDIDMTQLAPLLRAAAYFDIFDGEICNGGVAQYFLIRRILCMGLHKRRNT